MLGTINGFSLTYPDTASSGGGGGQTLAWARELVTLTVSTSETVIFLSHNPLQEEAIQIWWQGEILHPADYIYNAGPNRINIPIPVVLPADNPETGIWDIVITYPYAL